MPKHQHSEHQHHACHDSSSHSDFSHACQQALRQNGGRITKTRLAVVRCLERAKRPMSAREVFDAIDDDPEVGTIDQVSVYRILQTLKEHDLVHQVAPSGGYVACTHTACSSNQHALLRCAKCERIEELDLPESIAAPLLSHLRRKKFYPSEHIFQIDGLCARCRK